MAGRNPSMGREQSTLNCDGMTGGWRVSELAISERHRPGWTNLISDWLDLRSAAAQRSSVKVRYDKPRTAILKAFREEFSCVQNMNSIRLATGLMTFQNLGIERVVVQPCHKCSRTIHCTSRRALCALLHLWIYDYLVKTGHTHASATTSL